MYWPCRRRFEHIGNFAHAIKGKIFDARKNEIAQVARSRVCFVMFLPQLLSSKWAPSLPVVPQATSVGPMPFLHLHRHPLAKYSILSMHIAESSTSSKLLFLFRRPRASAKRIATPSIFPTYSNLIRNALSVSILPRKSIAHACVVRGHF